MNYKKVVLLLLICVFCFCCEQKQQPPEIPTGINIKIEGNYDPNTTAIVTLKLEGETLPGTPKVVSAEDTSLAYFEKMGTSEDVRQVPETENLWIAVLEAGESYVIGWIVEDNKMFGYCSEPFVAKNGLDVTFSPGMPATLEYDISKPEDEVHTFPAFLLLARKAIKNGEVSLMNCGKELIEKPQVIKIDGLASGTFQIRAQCFKAEEYVDERARFLNDTRFIEIEQGKVNRFEAEFPLLDTTVEDGDVTIKGLVYNSAGETLPNEKIMLVPINSNSPRFDLYYPETTSDSKGNFEFKGVRPDINVLVKSVGGSINLPKRFLVKDSTLWIDYVVGKLNQKIFPEYAIPDFTVIWKDGQSARIQELWGKIAVIKIWSSWCSPSVEALTEFNSLAQKYKDNEEIVFVAMSLDDSRSNWEDTVNKSDLDALRHCWYDLDNKLAFNRPIPYSIIFDKKNIVHAEGLDVDIRSELEKVIEASKEE